MTVASACMIKNRDSAHEPLFILRKGLAHTLTVFGAGLIFEIIRYSLRRERKHAKKCRFSPFAHSDSINISPIENRRAGGESTHDSAFFPYTSFCGMINSQILNGRPYWG